MWGNSGQERLSAPITGLSCISQHGSLLWFENATLQDEPVAEISVGAHGMECKADDPHRGPLCGPQEEKEYRRGPTGHLSSQPELIETK